MKERTYRFTPRESEDLDALIEESYVRFVQLERRNLLVISFVLLFSNFTKINPAKGTFLGLSFEQFEESHFYLTLLGLLLYFTFAFSIYAYPQYKSALVRKEEISKKAMTVTSNVTGFHIEWARVKLDVKYYLWLSFHFYLPIGLAVWALVIGCIKIV